MTQEEKDRLFAQLLSEYRELFADMDELNRTLWFAANEENELMSFIVESGESTDEAMERYKAKLLAIASALESLPCASTERHTITELRDRAVSVSVSWPAEKALLEGDDYLSDLARMSPLELSQHVDELYKQTMESLRSEGAI
ncbi:hypothetical protein JLK41_18105 [Ectopseudomonas khazarica]|uniref:hypothetical protein n=1 Tax=Ectopseudomonas khazarica TaxID=2502979 RepID=UPI001AEF8B0A|nr:hypothetical protein [Pseudomonas khazarica]QTS85221.1 hypothetical protein JLK41_18105 [Pseudomonas khazarica]